MVDVNIFDCSYFVALNGVENIYMCTARTVCCMCTVILLVNF